MPGAVVPQPMQHYYECMHQQPPQAPLLQSEPSKIPPLPHQQQQLNQLQQQQLQHSQQQLHAKIQQLKNLQQQNCDVDLRQQQQQYQQHTALDSNP